MISKNAVVQLWQTLFELMILNKIIEELDELIMTSVDKGLIICV